MVNADITIIVIIQNDCDSSYVLILIVTCSIQFSANI